MEDRKNRDFSKGPVWNSEKNRWLVEIRYPDGSRIRKRFRREREALRAWSAEEAKIENGTWSTRALKSITLGAAIELYEQHAKIELASYASHTEPAMKVWKANIPVDTPLARVTAAMIDAVKLRRAEEVKKSSVDRNLQVLRRFFNWCIEQGLAVENPMKRVKFFRADTKRLRYLTEVEFARLLEEAGKVTKSPFLPEAIELAVYTGCVIATRRITQSVFCPAARRPVAGHRHDRGLAAPVDKKRIGLNRCPGARLWRLNRA